MEAEAGGTMTAVVAAEAEVGQPLAQANPAKAAARETAVVAAVAAIKTLAEAAAVVARARRASEILAALERWASVVLEGKAVPLSRASPGRMAAVLQADTTAVVVVVLEVRSRACSVQVAAAEAAHRTPSLRPRS